MNVFVGVVFAVIDSITGETASSVSVEVTAGSVSPSPAVLGACLSSVGRTAQCTLLLAYSIITSPVSEQLAGRNTVTYIHSRIHSISYTFTVI